MTAPATAQIVTFRLGEDMFAADINDVERVLRYAEPTPVPNVPDWVKGVIEYRSRVVPVIDLRARFDLEAAPLNGSTRIIILSADGDWVAAVVDAVLEVIPLGGAQLAAPPALFRGLSAEFLRGILRRHDRLVIVLDVARLLSARERLAFDAAAAADASGIGGGIGYNADLAGADTPLRGESGLGSAFRVSTVGAPPPTRGPSVSDLLGSIGGTVPTDGGPLGLVTTSEEAPRPDQSIIVSTGGDHHAGVTDDEVEHPAMALPGPPVPPASAPGTDPPEKHRVEGTGGDEATSSPDDDERRAEGPPSKGETGGDSSGSADE